MEEDRGSCWHVTCVEEEKNKENKKNVAKKTFFDKNSKSWLRDLSLLNSYSKKGMQIALL